MLVLGTWEVRSLIKQGCISSEESWKGTGFFAHLSLVNSVFAAIFFHSIWRLCIGLCHPHSEQLTIIFGYGPNKPLSSLGRFGSIDDLHIHIFVCLYYVSPLTCSWFNKENEAAHKTLMFLQANLSSWLFSLCWKGLKNWTVPQKTGWQIGKLLH